MKTKTAIVILNWNGQNMLRQFLPSVIEHSSDEGVAVYVADNGSTDDSLSVLEHEFPTVKRIVLAGNHGFAQGYNLALKEVKAEYYVLLNSDVEVTHGWLSPLIDALEAEPGVAACQPKIRSYHKRDYFEYAGACGGFIDRYGYTFCRGRLMDVIEKDSGQYDSVKPVFWASGAALAIRASCYHNAGGLDGRFFAHMEEIDLCWRLNNMGYTLLYIPQSTVYHVGGATLAKGNPRKTYLNFRNNLFMLYKNLNARELNNTLFIRHCLDWVAALFFLLQGKCADAKAVMQAKKSYNALLPQLKKERADNAHYPTETRKLLRGQPCVLNGSLLVQYYLKKKRTFSSMQMKGY